MTFSCGCRAPIAVHAARWMDHAFARIAGRAAQTEFGPGIKIGDRIDDPPAELAVDRSGAETAMLFQRAGGQAQMYSGVGRPQEPGYDGGGSGIHGLAPLAFEGSGELPLVAGSNGEVGMRKGSDRMEGEKTVTPCEKLAVAKQLAISAVHHPARCGDEPERMPTLVRPFPGRADERDMARVDEAVGEVMHSRTCVEAVMNGEKLDKPGTPIGGRRTRTIWPEAQAARHPLIAGSGGKPQGGAFVKGDDKASGVVGRRSAHAKAKPGGIARYDQMLLVWRGGCRQSLKAGWQRHGRCAVDGCDDDDVGRCGR